MDQEKKPLGRTRSVDSIGSLCSLDSFKFNPYLKRQSSGQSSNRTRSGVLTGTTCDRYARLCSPPCGGKAEDRFKDVGPKLCNPFANCGGAKETAKRVPSDAPTVYFCDSPIKSPAGSPVAKSPRSPSFMDCPQPSPPKSPSSPKASSPDGQFKKRVPSSPEPSKSPSFMECPWPPSPPKFPSSPKASSSDSHFKKRVPSSPEPWRMHVRSDSIPKQESAESLAEKVKQLQFTHQCIPPQKTPSITLGGGGADPLVNSKGGTVAKAGGKFFKPVLKLFNKPKKTTSLLRTNLAHQVGKDSQPVEDEENLDLPTVPDYKIREEYLELHSFISKSRDLKNFMLDPNKPLRADSKVDPRAVINFLAGHMNHYYESILASGMTEERSHRLSRTVWDKLVYLIPLLCNQLVDLLRDEPLIVEVQPNVVVFGKLLANFNDLWHIYVHYLNNPAFTGYRFIFLGGYVDRGPRPIEVLCLLFALKLAYPDRFILLRGNHEVMKVNQKYGFQRLVHHIYGRNFAKHQGIMAPLVYRSFNQVFTYLPLGALIKGSGQNGSIFCCHGGVPSRYPKSKNSQHAAAANKPWTIAELNDLAEKPLVLTPSKKASPALRTLSELLWNIPVAKSVQMQQRQSGRHFYRDLQRGGHSSVFSQAALDAFLEANHLSLMIHGNQIVNTRTTGHYFDYNGRLLSVFSCSNYCGIEHNTTACVVITGDELAVEVRKLRDPKESGIFRYFNYLRIGIDTRTNQTVEMQYM